MAGKWNRKLDRKENDHKNQKREMVAMHKGEIKLIAKTIKSLSRPSQYTSEDSSLQRDESITSSQLDKELFTIEEYDV